MRTEKHIIEIPEKIISVGILFSIISIDIPRERTSIKKYSIKSNQFFSDIEKKNN
jgi:hypothetical protein